MKPGVFILLFLVQDGLAQSDSLVDRYQFRYPLRKNILAEAPLKQKPAIASATLLTIPAHTEVRITQKDNEFYKVIYANKAGYIPYIFLEKDYPTFKKRNYPHISIEECNDSVMIGKTPDTTGWYGRISVLCPIQKEPNSKSESQFRLPKGTILKIQRHDYSYWRVEWNGEVGYAGVSYIREVSKSASPFVVTKYTGPTYDRFAAAFGDSTSTTRSPLPANPQNSRHAVNRQGGKSAIRR